MGKKADLRARRTAIAKTRDGEGRIPGSFLDNSYQEPNPQIREANRVTLAAIHLHAVAEVERARRVIEFRAAPRRAFQRGRLHATSLVAIAALLGAGQDFTHGLDPDR